MSASSSENKKRNNFFRVLQNLTGVDKTNKQVNVFYGFWPDTARERLEDHQKLNSRCTSSELRWYDTLKYGDFHEKLNFFENTRFKTL